MRRARVTAIAVIAARVGSFLVAERLVILGLSSGGFLFCLFAGELTSIF
jgi:poly(3-hydroxybutyrate) depolymerase